MESNSTPTKSVYNLPTGRQALRDTKSARLPHMDNTSTFHKTEVCHRQLLQGYGVHIKFRVLTPDELFEAGKDIRLATNQVVFFDLVVQVEPLFCRKLALFAGHLQPAFRNQEILAPYLFSHCFSPPFTTLISIIALLLLFC